MNEYDSARIADLLKLSEKVELTDNDAEADILLLNTCSIREKAQEKVFHQLGRWKKLKDRKPDLKIGVGVVWPARKEKVSAIAPLCGCDLWPTNPAQATRDDSGVHH